MRGKRLLPFLLLAMVCWMLGGQAGAGESISPDPRVVQLVGQLVAALNLPSEAAREQAVAKLVHKSLLNPEGGGLLPNIKDYSFQKASKDIHLYKAPPEIVRAEKGSPTTIGYGPTAETGRRDKYFVAKKDGVNGLPAPVIVFVPDGGGSPKVVDFGSF